MAVPTPLSVPAAAGVSYRSAQQQGCRTVQSSKVTYLSCRAPSVPRGCQRGAGRPAASAAVGGAAQVGGGGVGGEGAEVGCARLRPPSRQPSPRAGR